MSAGTEKIESISKTLALSGDADCSHIMAPSQVMITAPVKHSGSDDQADKTQTHVLAVELRALREDVKSLQMQSDYGQRVIDLQNNHFSLLLSIVAILVGAFALAVPLAGLIGYFSIRRKAKEEAVLVVERTVPELVDQWISSNLSNINDKANGLHSKFADLERDASEKARSTSARVDEIAGQAINRMQEKMNQVAPKGRQGVAEPIPRDESLALAMSANSADLKPAADRDYDEWNTIAFEAAARSDMSHAAQAWLEASNVEGVDNIRAGNALANAARAIAASGDRVAAIKIFEKASDRLESAGSAGLDSLAKLFIHKAYNFGELSRVDEEVDVYNEIISRFSGIGSSTDIHVARAYVNKALVFLNARHFERSIACADEIISANFTRDDHLMIGRRAAAWGIRGDALQGLEKYQEAILSYERQVDLGRQCGEQGVSEVIAGLIGKGFSLVCSAKGGWDSSPPAPLLSEAMQCFKEAEALDPDDFVLLENIAYCNYLLGKESGATSELVARSLMLGGEDAMANLIENVEVKTLPIDSGFRKIVDTEYKKWASKLVTDKDQ